MNLFSAPTVVNMRDLKFYCKEARIVEFALQGKQAQGKKLSPAETQDLAKIKAVREFVKRQADILRAIEVEHANRILLHAYIDSLLQNYTNPSDMR